MLVVKNPPTKEGDIRDAVSKKKKEMQFRSLGWEDPLEEGMATYSSILVWRIPRTEEPGGIQSMGSQRIRYN